jgi:hypothetical protein
VLTSGPRIEQGIPEVLGRGTDEKPKSLIECRIGKFFKEFPAALEPFGNQRWDVFPCTFPGWGILSPIPGFSYVFGDRMIEDVADPGLQSGISCV